MTQLHTVRSSAQAILDCCQPRCTLSTTNIASTYKAGDILGIFHGPAAAVTNAPVDSDEVAPLLRLVRIFSLVPQGH